MTDGIAFDVSKIKESFFAECEDYISSMEGYILELEEKPDDGETLNALFRAAHSIKGNSGCLGFNDIYSFTHKMETLLDKLRNGEIGFDAELSSLLLDAVDCIKGLVEAAKSGGAAPDTVQTVLNGIGSYIGEETQGPSPADKQAKGQAHGGRQDSRSLFRIVFRPHPEIFKTGMDPLRLLRKLSSMGEIIGRKTLLDRLPSPESMDPEQCYLAWELYLLSDQEPSAIEAIFEFVKEHSQLEVCQLLSGGTRPSGAVRKDRAATAPSTAKRASSQPTKGSTAESSTIRVDIEKIEQLVNLVGELLITQTMIDQLSSEMDRHRGAMLERAISQLKRNTMAIQERVMSIRMLPIGNIFTRLKRLVRDIATQNQKKIRLEISGEETELDKTVIEKLVDPLTHLLRNAVDHGIEPPEERVERGKPEEGVVAINAFHEGGKVVITVEDDGRGINKEKVLKKAIERGLVEDHRGLTDEEVYSLIFTPGFSTADRVTDVSGRGVGMDVVKRNIESMGGSISIESCEGRFTKFILRLPLTLAIIDGLIVRVGSEKFIIPITAVIESKRPSPEEVKTVESKGEVIDFRGSFVPLIRLHQLFGIEPTEYEPWRAIVVVVSIEGRYYGLLVDELIGEQQVVIKSMGCLQGIRGIAGGTILGDGKIALIIDGAGLIKERAYSSC